MTKYTGTIKVNLKINLNCKAHVQNKRSTLNIKGRSPLKFESVAMGLKAGEDLKQNT
jgi:hypothetical protein